MRTGATNGGVSSSSTGLIATTIGDGGVTTTTDSGGNTGGGGTVGGTVGGTEIFYGGDESPILRLAAGDAICFPPYVMHRAIPVKTGERWTLAMWLLGDRPFR